MTRDDEVQTNLKIPKSLKDNLKAAAKENHRSMTAELIARLQESFISEPQPAEELIPAGRAKELSVKARQDASVVMRKRILDSINLSVSKGHATALADFEDLQLELMPEADQERLIAHFSDWLEAAGYEVEWNGSNDVFIRFDDL